RAYDDRIVPAGEGLGDRQHHRIAPRQIIVGQGVVDRFGDSRHQGLPDKRPLLLSADEVNRYCRGRRSGMILIEPLIARGSAAPGRPLDTRNHAVTLLVTTWLH